MSLFDVYPLFDITPVKAKDVFDYKKSKKSPKNKKKKKSYNY